MTRSIRLDSSRLCCTVAMAGSFPLRLHSVGWAGMCLEKSTTFGAIDTGARAEIFPIKDGPAVAGLNDGPGWHVG
ncbi:MAG TPA: hypothetical protein VGY56_15060 [Verrucomicrobiae bacterium]|nr:hypothetical protein [Verrucomicrobiae bacterium]